MGIELAKYPKKYFYNNFFWGIENMENLNKYIDEKVLEFKNCYQKENEKIFKKNLIQEFFEIYEYDCEYSDMPLDKLHESKKQGNQKILLYDMMLILGNIFLGMHSEIAKNKLPYQKINIPNRVINYNELYYEAINSYFLNLLGIKGTEIIDINKAINAGFLEEEQELRKMIQRHCILTTYAMLPLTEYMLCEKLVSIMLYTSVNELIYRVQSGKIEITEEDFRFIYKFNFNPKVPQVYIYENSDMDKLYGILTHYGVFKDTNSNKEILTRHKWKKTGEKLGRTTLGDLLSNDYFKENCEPEYCKLFEIIFGVKNINLRNTILHGSGASFDYFNITFTSILVQLFWDIINNHVFKMDLMNVKH